MFMVIVTVCRRTSEGYVGINPQEAVGLFIALAGDQLSFSISSMP